MRTDCSHRVGFAAISLAGGNKRQQVNKHYTRVVQFGDKSAYFRGGGEVQQPLHCIFISVHSCLLLRLFFEAEQLVKALAHHFGYFFLQGDAQNRNDE